MKKKFGQHFLVNTEIINKIILNSGINSNSFVYEVGPGEGALTKEIIKINPKKFLSIDIDSSLKSKLDKIFVNNNHKLLISDALKFDEISYFENNAIIVGNLPYNISLKLLTKWIHQYLKKKWFKSMILMFQKEVGERIIASAKSKKYGRISLLVSAVFKVVKITEVSKDNFFPKPKVDSVVLLFKPLEKPYFDAHNIKNLEQIALFFFSNRRKKLKKKIELVFKSEVIKKNKLNLLYDLRAEDIDKLNYFNLAKLL